jgi:hypothetical protein
MKMCKKFKNEKLRHSQRPKNGGGGDATTQQCNGKIETSKKRKKKKKKVTTGKAGIGPLRICDLTLIQRPNSIQQSNSTYILFIFHVNRSLGTNREETGTNHRNVNS